MTRKSIAWASGQKVYSQPPTAVFSTVLQSHYSALTTRQYLCSTSSRYTGMRCSRCIPLIETNPTKTPPQCCITECLSRPKVSQPILFHTCRYISQQPARVTVAVAAVAVGIWNQNCFPPSSVARVSSAVARSHGSPVIFSRYCTRHSLLR